MRSRRSAQIIAIAGATVVFLSCLVVLRRPSFMVIGLGGFAYLALLIAFWPRRTRSPTKPLPETVSREDFDLAMQRLGDGAAKLRAAIAELPAADAPLFARLAELIETIRGHLRANPEHVRLTRTFVRHTLARMMEIVGDYVRLVRRSGPGQEDRLAEISRRFEAFVPALEKIDQACLENDLTALEISVEVLGEQIDRTR